ncbi:golgi complex component 7 COG7 [Nitzschia inconspicua]|uniref:Conserved oligomeric Golgi complex subunit 7 n=1 Tax=Nitzschia inconspicua TaxID=303405 RepID=A0A9K3PNT7_9STRA|nr:golgi complex component 7 COG7 [Nitzschia inconspicua]
MLSSTAPSSGISGAAGGGGGSLEDDLNALLSSSDFTVASYLNMALAAGTSVPEGTTATSNRLTGGQQHPDELQRRMAELALQLQLETQQCHEDIGRIGAELQAILPRCAADVGRVGVGLEGMRIDAQALLESTSMAGEEELSSSLETLSTLHALQSNLSKTKEVLTAAATWDSTISSVAPLLSESNLTEAVNALAQLENGERALRGMPHRDERQKSIQEIREQVQVMLQPQLQHALQNMNSRIAPLQQCVALYTKLGKMDSLQDEYVKQRPGALHKAWFSYAPKTFTSGGEGMASAEEVAAAQRAGESFSTWLPSWYEQVLNLLTEERRQASTVFGPAEAPDIVVKVLREAFRPILPSFQSRLETVFSSSPAAPARGSFEAVGSVYESTLRFLSLAYDLVSGAFLDVAEAGGAKKGDTGFELYRSMQDVFLQLSSPFTLYAQRFPELEGKHTHVAAGMVSKDMQQTVGSISSNSGLLALQEATTRLKDLASFIFPMVESSLDRFELFNGGYRSGPALSAIDNILSNHLGELVICIRSLSAAMTSDANKLADDFDEQHVLCAMEVLKLAGNFRRDLRNFESGTRNRMKALAERVNDFLTQEAENKRMAEAIKEGNASSTSSFVLPDSLSVVEIDSYLSKVFCDEEQSNDDDMNASLLALQRYAAEGSECLYSAAEDAVGALASSCHSVVFDICSAVPRKHLNELSQMSAWREGASTDAFDSYGTLPQHYITQVGEHMLALVQAFEPFASGADSLSVANEVMDGVRNIALQPWSDFLAAAGFSGSDSVVPKLMGGKDIADLVLNNAALGEEDAMLEEGATADEIASAAFCNAWLDVIGLAVTGRLLERIMRISQLTPKGCDHLTSDLNYLVNVFSALGVAGHPHPLVSHLGTLATLQDADLEAQIKARDRSSDVQNAMRAIELRIARLRGLGVE